jgi:RimJ/RimL family protein N-acetyltransferase
MELTTARAVMRPVAPEDAPELHALWTSAGVRRFLWDDQTIPLARTHDAIAQSARLFRDRRYGLWGARTADLHRLLGFAGLWPFRDPPEIELLYGIGEPFWGQGCAGEIARAVIAYCFDVLDMAAIAASTDVANAASVRVLEKLAFHLTARNTVGGLDTLFFELRRSTQV